MTTQTLNSLARASSAYLRSAMHQPIRWHEWGEEAFATAQRENKPMLLDIGAVWCHWCHVMDRESYDDPEIAAIVNAHFVAVKVDRDERPDIDTRYQAAVQAVSGQGVWSPQFPPRAAQHCECLQREARGRCRASCNGRERDRAVRGLCGTKRANLG